jgi:hypothetical protein
MILSAARGILIRLDMTVGFKMGFRQDVEKWISGDFNQREKFGIIFPMIMLKDEETMGEEAFEQWIINEYNNEIASINAEVDSKCDAIHQHIIDDITGLQNALNSINTALSGKANTVHSHIISDVSGLQTALNGKANTSHSHVMADITGLSDALSIKLNTADLAAYLALKANVSHTHAIADITNLQTTLDGKISKNPKAAAIADVTTNPTIAGGINLTVLGVGVSVSPQSSVTNLYNAYIELRDRFNTHLAASRSRDIIAT